MLCWTYSEVRLLYSQRESPMSFQSFRQKSSGWLDGCNYHWCACSAVGIWPQVSRHFGSEEIWTCSHGCEILGPSSHTYGTESMPHEVDSLGQSQGGRLSRLAEVLVVWFGFHNCHGSGLRQDLGLCALVETNPSCPLLGQASLQLIQQSELFARTFH